MAEDPGPVCLRRVLAGPVCVITAPAPVVPGLASSERPCLVYREAVFQTLFPML